MRTEIWSSHVIIQSVSTKNFPGSFILSKYGEKTQLRCLSDLLFLLHEKELLFQSLIVAKQKPASLGQRNKMFCRLKRHKWQRPHSNIWKNWTQRKRLSTERKSLPGNIGIVLKFRPLVRTAQFFFHKKWQAMSRDGDSANHSWEGL